MGLIAAFTGGWVSAVPAPPFGSPTAGTLALLFELAEWRRWLGEAEALLDQAEAARVQRRHRVGDRDDLALAYALHRLALAQALGREPRAVALGRDGLGRPCLADEGLQTSLSHADGVVGVALAPGGRVGIDVEPVARIADMVAITDHVCAPSEARGMAALGDEARARELLALWVRKEALLKAAGIGLAREMPTFIAPDGATVALPLAEGGDDDEHVVVRMLDAGPACVAALACSGGAAQVAWLRPGMPA